MLEFSRQTEPNLRVVDVNEIVENALRIVDHEAKINNVGIVKNLDSLLEKDPCGCRLAPAGLR